MEVVVCLLSMVLDGGEDSTWILLGRRFVVGKLRFMVFVSHGGSWVDW